ncbi:J domain-containing protein [Chitinophaga rhizosphaerae]|uniref:J domain-containing protein n=1 Tax=Chitinophaga rhizosphaerae TaxID=1864947 RepID=UPI000F807C7C|nr:J domain-containing protein [Chitinophaga rhizosphaerae]
MPTLYQVLGVPENAAPAFIKGAFRKLSMQYHPDRNPGNPAAEALFREILEAYRILSDPNDRLRYDRQLAWSRVPPVPTATQTKQHTPPRNQPAGGYRNPAPPPPHAAQPPRTMPLKFMGIVLGALILLFVGLYNFGPKPKDAILPEIEYNPQNVANLPKGVSPEQHVLFANGDTTTYGEWHESISHHTVNESWQSFGAQGTPALFVTIYFTPDRHTYCDFVFLEDGEGTFRQVFRYHGGTYKNGTLVQLFFGRDVEPENCGDCEADDLPNPGITGIFLRELTEGYRFENATQRHERKIRQNLEWLAANADVVDFGPGGLQRQFLRQMLTWHFLHRADASAEEVFREYYQRPDVDKAWEAIARLIKNYENKIAFDVALLHSKAI